MSDSPRTTKISSLERTRVEELATQFAAAWQSQRPGEGEVYLSKFLPKNDDQLYVLMLHQLIPTDLAYRWRRGDKPLLEQYLESFPELGGASAIPVELIYDEYRIRTKYGDAPRLDSYQQRFPQQFVTFKTLLSQTLNTSLAWQLPEPLPSKPALSKSSPDPLRSTGSRKIMPGGEGYNLLECIGKGAFADVWKAEAPGGVEVAVKIIRWTASNKLSQVELRALELIKRLRHAFLLQVQAYWLSDGQLFIVMDLADRTLQQRLEECRSEGLPGIPVPELLGYLHEVAEALDYLHANDVLHRDIKPANIMLASGHAKLADFGLARLVMEKGTDIHATTTGTPLYMSPEVWGNKVGPASDQYSLASTYVELRLGRPLFTAETYADVMLDHLHTRPDLDPLPAAEQQVLHKALAKDNDSRYANCTEFVAALEAATIGDGSAAPASFTRRAALPVLFLLTSAIAIGLAAWIFNPWQPLELTAPAAIEIVAGEDSTFELHLRGVPQDQQIEPTFENVPEGLKLEPTISAAAGTAATTDASIWRIRVVSDLNLPATNYGKSFDVTARVVEGERSAERNLQITISPPVVTLPADCIPAPGAVRVHVAAENKNFWNRIVRKLPGNAVLASGKPCEFVLIPAADSGPKLASFYILENKVWNELFAAFDQQYPHDDQTDNEQWPDDWRRLGAAKGAGDLPADDHPLHPVMRTSFRQANACAKWLNGNLPTCEQWDTAAGRYLPKPPLGPFQGAWDAATAQPQIAVNRVESGPVAVGSARDDISPFQIRDMAGNGAEWTRDASSGEFSTVVLRGRRYDKLSPLFFDHLRDEGQQLDPTKHHEVEREDPTATSPYIGFRIVIEPM